MNPISGSCVEKQSGFSLFELMVVVAIIGLLAAVAVPKFSKFQAKAKQTEAQSMLTGIYTAETSFFSQFNTYYEKLLTIGYTPTGRVRYNSGFTGGSGVAIANFGATDAAGDFPTVGQICQSTCTGTTWTNDCCLLPEAQVAGAIPAANTWNVNAGGAATAFMAGAGGLVYHNTTSLPDQWVIDQAKNLRQTQNGIF